MKLIKSNSLFIIYFRIDMSFLGPESSKGNNTIDKNKKNLLDAIHSLENPEDNRESLKKQEEKNKSFWGRVSNFFNPFKCGKDV